MKRQWVYPVTFLAVLLAASTTMTVWFPRTGVVRMDQAVTAHPRWGELRLLQDEIVTREGLNLDAAQGQADIQKQGERVGKNVRAFSLTSLEKLKDEENKALTEAQGRLQKALIAKETEVWGRVQDKVQQEKTRLGNDLEQDLSLKRGQLQQEQNNYSDEIGRKYGRRILNIQIALEMVTLSSQERDKLEADLQGLKSDSGKLLTEKEQALDREYQIYEEAKRQEAERKLRAYTEALSREAQQELNEERDRLEAELNLEIQAQKEQIQRAINNLGENGGAGYAASSDPSLSEDPILQDLKNRAAALEVQINKDVQAAVSAAARQKRLKTVVQTSVARGRAIDITSMVMEILKAS